MPLSHVFELIRRFWNTQIYLSCFIFSLKFTRIGGSLIMKKTTGTNGVMREKLIKLNSWFDDRIKAHEYRHPDSEIARMYRWFNGDLFTQESRNSNKLRVGLAVLTVIVSIFVGSIVDKLWIEFVLMLILLGIAIYTTYKLDDHIKLSYKVLEVRDPIRDDLQQLLQMAEEATKGGFNKKIDIYTKDEIGQLADMFNMLFHNVSNFVGNLNVMSDESSKTSRHLEEISRTTSEVMQEVSATLQELSSTTQNLNSNLEELADGAVNVNSLTSDGLQKLEKLELKMKQMIEVADSASKCMVDISNASDKMSSIIEVVNNIANKTNMLALNAAIEAARAGDAGRGFAVVADEVRKLALSTQNSLEDIGVLVDGFREQTQKGIELIRENNKEISNGELILKETSENFNVIAQHISNMAEVVESSAAASAQIAKASHDITANTMVQATSIAEIAALSEQLSVKSTDLKRALSESYVGGSKIELDLDAFDKEYAMITEEDKQQLRAELGLTDRFVLGVISRLEPEKGLYFLLNGLKELFAIDDKSTCIIIGDGSLNMELKKYVRENELSKRVKFLGYRNDIAKLISIMDLVLLTSEKEGVPSMALMEAMAASKPIVASDVRGNQILVEHNKSGILVEYNDTGKLAASIMKFIAKREVGYAFGQEGRRRIEQLARE